MLLYSMLSRLVLFAVFITTGAIILGYFVLTQSIHSNVIIAPKSNQTLPTIMYNCITHCSYSKMRLWTATSWAQFMQHPDISMTIIAIKTPTTVQYIKGVMLQAGIDTSGLPNILVIIV